MNCVFVVISAQDLLEQWAAEKLNFSDAYVDNDQLEIPASTTAQTAKTAVDIRREWDHLTELDIDECLTSDRDIEDKGQSSRHRKQQKNNGNMSVTQLLVTVCYLVLLTKLAAHHYICNCKKLLRSSAYLLGLFDCVCCDIKRIVTFNSEFTGIQAIT